MAKISFNAPKNPKLAEVVKGPSTKAPEVEEKPIVTAPKAKVKEAAKDVKEEAPKLKARIRKAPEPQTPAEAAPAKVEVTSHHEEKAESTTPPSEHVAVKTEAKAPEVKSSETKPTETAAKPAATYVPPAKGFVPAPPRKDLKAKKPKEEVKFDARYKAGLVDTDEQGWRKKRHFKPQRRNYQEETIVRPTSLSIRLPITVKDLAHQMSYKASQLISKLFADGQIRTLNDYLDDEDTVSLLGMHFNCAITIDKSEEKRIRINPHTIREEIEKTNSADLVLRPPVVTFMGHVDHGKTSLIDFIRKSNRAAHEAGAITQHIGAFRVNTAAGAVTILDTPGHEAFSEMRSRGANVTDIVVLVVAGDEGVRKQTKDSILKAREAGVPILVALNKCDKPNFDAQARYRELSEEDLLPETWGGTVITVNCSATTGEGVNELLEMIALQAEILELRANPLADARGSVLESEMHEGLGATATVLVLNGTLRKNDAIVFGSQYGRIKTMHDDFGKSIEEAGPGVPAKITGLSDLAPAGSEFFVVKSDKEARELAEARAEMNVRTAQAQAKLSSLEKMMAKREQGEKKILPVILRADMEGSLEALTKWLQKFDFKKVQLEFVNSEVGKITPSDIELAAATKATIVGFHTHIDSRAVELNKDKNVPIISAAVIYEIEDLIKAKMKGLLDKLAEEVELGLAEVTLVIKASSIGLIAGCMVKSGVMRRGCQLRQIRNKQVIWEGKLASLKHFKEDVKEMKEGFECGLKPEGQTDVKEGDIFQAYEIHYKDQEL